MRDSTSTRPKTTPRIVELAEQKIAVVDVDGTVAAIPGLWAEAFRLTSKAIEDSGAEYAGHPFARYLAMGERIRAEVGFPFRGTLRPTDRVRESTLPAGRMVTITHVGPYDQIGTTWDQGTTWLRAQGLLEAGAPWECYLTAPDDPGPPVSELYWPIR